MAEVTDAVLAARAKWRFRGAARPSFAPAPRPGQESVWDYPRPPDDVEDALLRPSGRTTFCEWKGLAREFDATDRDGVAWTYVDTFPEFTRIAGYFSFYPGRVHCTVEGETVRPQAGDYYGGWVTGEVLGPMKGAPGSAWW